MWMRKLIVFKSYSTIRRDDDSKQYRCSRGYRLGRGYRKCGPQGGCESRVARESDKYGKQKSRRVFDHS